MPEKRSLTDAFIKNFTLPEKRIEIPDSVAPGMVLRVTPKGSKSFAFRYWYNGASKQRTIGRYGEYTLAEARATATEWRKLLNEGIDLIAEKNKRKNEKSISLGEYITLFSKEYVERRLRPSTQKTYKSRLNKISSHSISKMPLIEITRSQIRSFLKAESKARPTNANRIQSILSKLFNEAIEDGHINKNPLIGMGKLTVEEARDVSYSNEQIKNIWDAISDEWQPMRALLRMLLITGQRLGETSRMKWADIDKGVWRISSKDTKNKKAHIVPLSTLALREIEDLTPISGAGEYVFTSLKNPNKHISEFANATKRIRSKTELPDFRLHDLRHIVATGMIGLGIEFVHVGRVLNHKGLSASNFVTSKYINTEMEEQKREAINIWGNELIGITSQLKLKSHSTDENR